MIEPCGHQGADRTFPPMSVLNEDVFALQISQLLEPLLKKQLDVSASGDLDDKTLSAGVPRLLRLGYNRDNEQYH